MTVSQYLCTRLEELGLTHVFGIPGDYVMEVMDAVLASNLKLVGNCNELNGGYAADGYARVHGLGVMIVTYDVGGFSAYNAIAGACAERVPVVLVSGSPALAKRAQGPMHHMVRDYNHQREIYERVTAAALAIEDPARAPQIIDHVLSTCLRERQPVYLEIPLDLAEAECAAPRGQLERGAPAGDSSPLAAEVACRLEKAARPALLVGAQVGHYGQSDVLERFLAESGLPAAVTIDALTVVRADHPNYVGLYRGALGNPQAREVVESSDCLICLGTHRNDITSGDFTSRIDQAKVIHVTGTELRDLMPVLKSPSRRSLTTTPPATRPAYHPKAEDPLTSDRLFDRLDTYLGAHHTVVSDTGDALFQSASLSRIGRLVSQPYYLSIGYALPAGMGVALASPGRRTVVIIGDGAFQMTAQELSGIVRYRLPVTVILLNNDGYVIERVLHGEAAYNDLNRWRYADFARSFGEIRSLAVRTEGELEAALQEPEDGPLFIEAVLPRNDVCALMKAINPGMI